MNLKNKDLIKSFDATSFLWSGGMGGGSGGVAEDLLTTKGDTHGYTTENARVPIGVDGQVITADSTDALGLGWATPSGASASDNITAGGITATLGDWVLVDTYVPTALTSLVATAVDDTSIALTYNSIIGERVKTVQVDYSLNEITWTTATTTAGITSYTITGLTPNTPYYIRVYPTNIIGQGLVTATAGTTTTHIIPNTPANFALSASSSPAMSVNVSWDLSTIGNPAPTYTLERSADNITFSVLSSTIGDTTTTYNDSTNPTDTLLYYRLKAVNAIGSSAYTATETINIPFNPVTSYGNAVENEGGVISGYNTYTYLTTGTSTIVLSASATVEVLLVGGGGNGQGYNASGSSGVGGSVMVSNTFTLTSGTHNVVVPSSQGAATFFGISATGGSGTSTPNPSFPAGITGTVYGGYSSGVAGTTSPYLKAGGGAGANGNGGNGSGSSSSGTGGTGGHGIQLSGFESVSYYYGGGAGGSSGQSSTGNGGRGGNGGGAGGGSGNDGSSAIGASGTGGRTEGEGTPNQSFPRTESGDGGANTGGGGSCTPSSTAQGVGGSGIIVIKVTA